MGDGPVEGRVAHIEGVMSELVPAIRRMEQKLDDSLRQNSEKASKASVALAHEEIDSIRLVLTAKADKSEVVEAVKEVKGELRGVRDKTLIWTGIGMAVFVLLSWYGQKLLNMLASN